MEDWPHCVSTGWRGWPHSVSTGWRGWSHSVSTGWRDWPHSVSTMYTVLYEGKISMKIVGNYTIFSRLNWSH